ncbi:MAG TPA: winged helix-turn-helix domain-containing protein [Candidatus Nitrosocosmicus sp.]
MCIRLRKNYPTLNKAGLQNRWELIIKKSGKKYHYTHTYRILRKLGFKQKISRKVHVNTASQDEKKAFKKRQNRYLWISILKNKNSKKRLQVYYSIIG